MINDPKLRDPYLADVIINNRFCTWYTPNPNQAGFRKGQGCQIFSLFLTINMAKYLNTSIYIGLLDFEKAFDFMNRPLLIDDLRIGSAFLRNLYLIYEKVSYVPKVDNMMGREMDANHGVTQGRHSSCNIFSFYTSDIINCIKDIQLPDFTNLFNILQLVDDTLLLSEYEHPLAILFEKIFTYGRVCL